MGNPAVPSSLTPQEHRQVLQADAFTKALATLPIESLNVIRMRHFEEMDWDEIAEHLALASEGAAKQVFKKAMIRLSKELKQYGKDAPPS